jgi:hypothetical protein
MLYWILDGRVRIVFLIDHTINGFMKQINEIREHSLSPHMCKNHSQNPIRGVGFFLSLYGAILVCTVSAFHHTAGFTDTNRMEILPYRHLWEWRESLQHWRNTFILT